MELKKNPKANVGRNSSLYFAIGLALMLFLTNFAINYKTYDKAITDIGVVSMDQEWARQKHQHWHTTYNL